MSAAGRRRSSARGQRSERSRHHRAYGGPSPRLAAMRLFGPALGPLAVCPQPVSDDLGDETSVEDRQFEQFPPVRLCSEAWGALVASMARLASRP